MNKELLNAEFTDGIDELKVLEYMERHNMYRIENFTEKRKDQLLKEEAIQEYLNNAEYYINRLNKNKEYELRVAQERREEEEKERIKQEKYNFCYGYLDNKTALQRGKILKALNQLIKYDNVVYTKKDLLVYLLKNKHGVYTEERINTNRYSSKKIQLEYKKLVDKKEYYVWFNEDGKTGIDINKTEYDYINYLIDNNITV